MPRFFQESKPGVVWNPKAGCVGARFAQGVLDTEDPEVCELLAANGYIFEGELPEVQVEEPDTAGEAHFTLGDTEPPVGGDAPLAAPLAGPKTPAMPARTK